jgi:flagellar hook-associated protein 3 FlgL
MAIRISTASIYANSTNQMNSLQTQMAKLQMQLSSQKRILSPSDDPVASSRILEVTQSQSMNTQFASNRTSAKASLEQEDTALSSVTDWCCAPATADCRRPTASRSRPNWMATWPTCWDWPT